MIINFSVNELARYYFVATNLITYKRLTMYYSWLLIIISYLVVGVINNNYY